MNTRPRLGNAALDRLRKLVAQPSVEQLEPTEVHAPRTAASVVRNSQPLFALPTALAALLDPGPPSNAEPRLLAPGTQVGRYEIVQLLGAGGMGMVYEAIDPRLERRVALKLLKSSHREDTERGLREARALAQLTHPNVVPVFDVGEVEDMTYVAMALIDGASLRRQLGIWARPWSRVKSTFVQVGRALEAAHAAGLVHCDVKPDNVLVDRHGHAYVADFGLARCFLPAPLGAPTATASQGKARWFGTPGYVAPELEQGHEPSPQSDQFSYCVMVIESLVGQPPETEPGSPVPKPEHLVSLLDRAPVSKHVKLALKRGIESAPERRFSDMGALSRALEGPMNRRALAVGLVLTTVAALGVGLGLASMLSHSKAQTKSSVVSPLTDEAQSDLPAPTAMPLPALPHTTAKSTATVPHPESISASKPPAMPRSMTPSENTKVTAIPFGRASSSSAPAAQRATTQEREEPAAPTRAEGSGARQRPFGPRK